MPVRKKRKKTKKELHEEIGELLQTAKARAEILEHAPGSKLHKTTAARIRSDISRAHSAFKASIGRR
jgi:glucose-6-phosphate-specific signal transduction histidine kinase